MFDRPVRILLAGQAMGRAFCINASGADAQIAPIDRACGADDAQRVDVQLGGSSECQLDSGGDKAAYVYHMTRFGTVESGSGANAAARRPRVLGSPGLGRRKNDGRRRQRLF